MTCRPIQDATPSLATKTRRSLTCAIAVALSPAACAQISDGGSHGRAAWSARGISFHGSLRPARITNWFGHERTMGRFDRGISPMNRGI